MIGALNEAYNFLYSWLFGSAPVSALVPYAEPIALFISLTFICCMMYFCFRLVTGLIKLVYYMFQ